MATTRGRSAPTASIIFNGNIDGNVEAIARTTHSVRNDTAFHDRWHAYLPGWEMRPEHFTRHLGFIADYIAEIFHNELRHLNYTDLADQHFVLGNHVGQRDRKAALRTVSGLVKLIHPDGKCSKEELGEYLSFGLELRRRVKEQLKRINPIEFSRVNLSFIDKETGEERFAECVELGAIRLIPEGPLPPGDIFSIAWTPTPTASRCSGSRPPRWPAAAASTSSASPRRTSARAPRWPSTTCAPTAAVSASTATSAATTSTSRS
ncbi:MAG: hypothetical protein IPK80_28620 [Nannocystis sp.]|nr:hypothetical protein [Nannocystis sp.]